MERIGAGAALVARKLKLDPGRVELIRVAAPLHDVGKTGIPDEILLKPGGLTPEERLRMQDHAEFGYRLLTGSGSDLLETAATIAWTHHEQWDGSGYPRGLTGAEIPVEGRITAVMDVFDALTHDRVYRPAMELDDALEIIRAGRGRHFDPDVLDAFLDSLDELIAAGESVRRVRLGLGPWTGTFVGRQCSSPAPHAASAPRPRVAWRRGARTSRS